MHLKVASMQNVGHFLQAGQCISRLAHWPLGNVAVIFRFTHFMNSHFERCLWNWCKVSATKLHWSQVNTGWGNGLVPSYPAVPDDNPAVPDIFPSVTIRSPKNSITMMLIHHCNQCLHFRVQSQRFLRVLWLCKVTAMWPDPVSSMTHQSVHSLVNSVRSTWTSFLVRVIESTATAVRKVSEVTKEMKLHDYD